MFKADWEKTSTTHSLPPGMVDKMLWFEYPDKILISQELMAGGCANLNVKILLKGEDSPQILRVYLRDKNAAYREKKIRTLLKKAVPLPEIYTIAEGI